MSSTLLKHSFSHRFCEGVRVWVKTDYLKLVSFCLLGRQFHYVWHQFLYIFVTGQRVNFFLYMAGLIWIYIGSRDVSEAHHTWRLLRQLQHPLEAEVVNIKRLQYRVVKFDARSAINYYLNLVQHDITVCWRKSKSFHHKIALNRPYF